MTRTSRILSKIMGITLIALALSCFLGTAAGVLAAEPLKLTILHMNDIHAHYLPYAAKGFAAPIGGFAKARTVMAAIEKENQQEGRQTLGTGGRRPVDGHSLFDHVQGPPRHHASEHHGNLRDDRREP